MNYLERLKILEYIKNTTDPKESGILQNECIRLLFSDEYLSLQNRTKILTLLNAMHEDSFYINNNFSGIKDIIKSLCLLLYSNNIEIIKENFYKLYNNKEFENFIFTTYDIYEDKVKTEYANKLAKRFTPEGTFVDKNGVNYSNVVDITNEDFLLNVHNINIGFGNKAVADTIVECPKKFVEKNFGNSNNISGTMLSPDFISYASYIPDTDVLYGFNRLKKEDIITIGNQDIATTRNTSKSPKINYHPTILYQPDKLLDHIKWKYAESVIWRSSQGEKRKPNYILCVDFINENSLKHANYFNIPIYFINSIELLKRKLSKLSDEFETFKNKEIDLIDCEIILDKISSFSYQLFGLEGLLYNFSEEEYLKLKNEQHLLEAKTRDYIKRIIPNYDCKKENYQNYLMNLK